MVRGKLVPQRCTHGIRSQENLKSCPSTQFQVDLVTISVSGALLGRL